MDQNTKSQAIEEIKKAQNILVTVSDNPSLDQLAAALGLTLFLNKIEKHATAVFSGQIPSTIEFLKPDEVLENNTDSLRDFIVSLDKNKADKLRYKVEDDVVRIYITPYHTSLSEKDLIFSQGDFNVDLVLALGVSQKEHIDKALADHGRVLHDAVIIGLLAGEGDLDIGNINWKDVNASSLCEMLNGIAEAIKPGEVDSQIATAYLTGIVAETERFSNAKTTPKAMTMSAQLMSAGANQQLISQSLDKPEPLPEATSEPEISPELGEPENPEQPTAEDVGVLDLHHELDVPDIDDEDDAGQENTENNQPNTPENNQPNTPENRDQLPEEFDSSELDDFPKSQGSFKGKTIQPTGKVSQSLVVPSEESTESINNDDILPVSINDEEYEKKVEEVIRSSNEPFEHPIIKKETSSRGFVDNPPSSLAENKDNNDEDELPSIEQGGQKYSKYIMEPPRGSGNKNYANNGVFGNDENQVPDSLAEIPSAGPIQESQDFGSNPLLQTQHDAESVPITEVTTTEDPLLVSDGDTGKGTPLGPAVSDHDTLDVIDEKVSRFEYGNEQPATAEEQARQAVASAVDNTKSGINMPQPLQDIGAQFYHFDEPEVTSNQDAPPAVPPPIMPMPDFNSFQNDDSSPTDLPRPN